MRCTRSFSHGSLALFALAVSACADSATPAADTQGSDLASDAATTPDTSLDTTGADLPDSSAPDASDASPDDATVTPTTHTLRFGGWTMQPQQETTRCVILRLDNAEPILVNRIRTRLSKGSHHLIVYRTAATNERREPFACNPFTDTISGQTIPIVISQVRDDTIELPPGVAYEFDAHQMIRLEAHYLDYFPEPITTDIEVNFDVLPASAAVERADILFYGTLNVFIPKGQSVTTPWHFYDVPPGLEVFAMTGHTHALGTNVEVEATTGKNVAGEALYPPADATFDWEEAPVARFEPPLEFGAGDGFRFRCSWTNTTEQDVGFGESATAEMCFFWAYYYPSQGPIIRF